MSTLPPSRRAFRLNTIFFKAAAVVAVTAALVAGTVSYFAYQSEVSIVKSRMVEMGATLTELTGHEAGGTIKFAKVEAAQAIAANLHEMTKGEVTEVLLLNLDGQVFHHFVGRPDDQLRAPMEALGNDMIEVIQNLAPNQRLDHAQELLVSDDGLIFAHPAYFGAASEIVGAFVMRLDPTAVLQSIHSDMKKMAIIAAAVFLVALGGASFLFRFFVSLPLSRLTQTVKEVAAGNYDVTIPNTGSGDEVGDIARAIEGFCTDLAASVETNRTGMFKGSGFEGASAALMIVDPDFRTLFTNESGRALLSTHFPSSVTGQSDDKQTSVLSLDKALKVLPGLVAEPLPQRMAFAVGADMIDLSVNAVRDARGQLSGYILEWRTTTVSRRNSAVLAAIDAGQMRAELLPSGQVVTANEHFARLFGQTEQGIEGRDVRSCVQLADAPETDIWAALSNNVLPKGLIRIETIDGTPALLDARFSKMTDAEGRLRSYVMLGSDVTRAQHALAAAETTRLALAAAQTRVVEHLSAALSRLSDGDLTCTLSEPFTEDYEKLRLDFNEAAEQLRVAMAEVVDSAAAIHGEVNDISSAADNLSRRTEQQAATLEETAAALDQMTGSVKSTAAVATTANTRVAEAKKSAETSGQVVREAVAAMGEIEQSSSKISRITSVIDEIAFQTNLLALNAGVEAARAGEAGRGFAVVASEVRDLAQRSSEAAREIAGLINASSEQVKRGVSLVAEAGRSLTGIQSAVGEIHDLVSTIAGSAKEQSNGIAELNTAVKHLDQVTQQNAAMFEETSAASQSLNRAASNLSQTTTRFTIASQPAKGISPRPPGQTARSWGQPSAPQPSAPARKPAAAGAFQSSRKVAKPEVRGSLALQPTPSDDWEDF